MSVLFLYMLAANATAGLCPSEIITTQNSQAPPGWETWRTPARHNLIAVKFYSSHPGSKMALKFDSTVKRQNAVTYIYNLSGTKEPWIECQYSFSSLALIRKIPVAKSCAATKSDGQGLVTNIQCEPLAP